MKQEEIEIQLWDYIDQTCSQQDKERIAALLEKDLVWQQAYQELLQFQGSLKNNIATEKLKDGFTSKVEQAIKQTATPQKTYHFHNWIIKGIAAFFIISISTYFIYALIQIDWSLTNSNTAFETPKLSLPELNFSYSPQLLYTLTFASLILILAFLDKAIFTRRTTSL